MDRPIGGRAARWTAVRERASQAYGRAALPNLEIDLTLFAALLGLGGGGKMRLTQQMCE